MKKLAVLGTILAVLSLIAIPASALAATGSSGDTTVGGTISTYYTLSPPGNIDLGTISAIGDIAKGNFNVSVSTNDGSVTTCGIVVADKQAGTKGVNASHLMNGSYALISQLFVAGGDKLSIGVLPPTGLALRAPTSPLANANIADFRISQNLAAGDLTHAGAYSMTLTFTATFGP